MLFSLFKALLHFTNSILHQNHALIRAEAELCRDAFAAPITNRREKDAASNAFKLDGFGLLAQVQGNDNCWVSRIMARVHEHIARGEKRLIRSSHQRRVLPA